MNLAVQMPEKRTIRLTLSYDGTDFAGWQYQKDSRTVQGELEKALRNLHGCDVPVVGAGRTDAGVHAAAQVAHFYSPQPKLPDVKYRNALNALLPRDIRILQSEATIADFHARFDASARTYRYNILCSRPALAHELRYAWQLWRQPEIDLLNCLASTLKGEIDCSSFSSPQDSSYSRKRYIYSARISNTRY